MLAAAVTSDDAVTVALLLLLHPEEQLFRRDSHGDTPLVAACRHGASREIVETLLLAGLGSGLSLPELLAERSSQDDVSALGCCVAAGRLDLVPTLLLAMREASTVLSPADAALALCLEASSSARFDDTERDALSADLADCEAQGANFWDLPRLVAITLDEKISGGQPLPRVPPSPPLGVPRSPSRSPSRSRLMSRSRSRSRLRHSSNCPGAHSERDRFSHV